MVVFERISDFILELPYPHFKYFPDWFFTGVLWATSAAAIHNVQQENPERWFDEVHPDDPSGRLWMEDDPLAYLGVLVDILQAWDRFSVYPNPVMLKRIPSQSRDVFIKVEDRRLKIKYKDNSDLAKKVTSDLNKSLKDWDKYVQIET